MSEEKCSKCGEIYDRTCPDGLPGCEVLHYECACSRLAKFEAIAKKVAKATGHTIGCECMVCGSYNLTDENGS